MTCAVSWTEVEYTVLARVVPTKVGVTDVCVITVFVGIVDDSIFLSVVGPFEPLVTIVDVSVLVEYSTEEAVVTITPVREEGLEEPELESVYP